MCSFLIPHPKGNKEHATLRHTSFPHYTVHYFSQISWPHTCWLWCWIPSWQSCFWNVPQVWKGQRSMIHMKSASVEMTPKGLTYALVSEMQVWALHLDKMTQRRVSICIFDFKRAGKAYVFVSWLFVCCVNNESCVSLKIYHCYHYILRISMEPCSAFYRNKWEPTACWLPFDSAFSYKNERRWYTWTDLKTNLPALSFSVTGMLDVVSSWEKWPQTLSCQGSNVQAWPDTTPHRLTPPDPWHSIHTFVWHSSFRADGALGFRVLTAGHCIHRMPCSHFCELNYKVNI